MYIRISTYTDRYTYIEMYIRISTYTEIAAPPDHRFLQFHHFPKLPKSANASCLGCWTIAGFIPMPIPPCGSIPMFMPIPIMPWLAAMPIPGCIMGLTGAVPRFIAENPWGSRAGGTPGDGGAEINESVAVKGRWMTSPCRRSPCCSVLRVGWLCLGGCAPGPRKSRLMFTVGSDQVEGSAALAPAP